MSEVLKVTPAMQAAWVEYDQADSNAMNRALAGKQGALINLIKVAFYGGWKSAEKHCTETAATEPTLLGVDDDDLVVRVDTASKSLRDQFACQALTITLEAISDVVSVTRDEALKHATQMAYEVADAMLEARKLDEGE